MIAINCSYFDVLVNSDAGTSALQYSLIAKEKVLSVISCLSACSLNAYCLTVAYHKTDLNCYLFQDQLTLSDIEASTSSNLYLK